MNGFLGSALAIVVLAGTMHLSADEAISITVRPAVATANGNAQLKVLVARNDMNRSLTWEVDGPNYFRSSTMELSGAAAPRTYFFVVRDLPAGEFEVRAIVVRNDSSQLMDRRTIRVVGGPE